ncbi:MAG TPA: MaoC/PaaZ C-terminal domain-containing protein [Acidimicrobiales bacterium]|nr:MaoC/PaaZ C-terminal domain-containing protein [Acidimicrobiales bacterium]
MPLNLNAVGSTSEPAERSWSSTDCLLYALGVGAGAIEATNFELEFTTENSAEVAQRVLPTFASIVGAGRGPRTSLGEFDPAMLVHAEQSIELHGPIPTEATVSTTSTVTAIYDKGSGALVRLQGSSVEVGSGRPLFSTGAGLFIRGEGGFGGERGPSSQMDPLPSRPPDEVVTYTTRPDQALLYRLSGDRNPLHSDPVFAKRAGFDRPILHGLCTYGFTGRALLHAICGSSPERFRSMYGRFSRPTFPGDTLTISIWADGSSARFRTENQYGDTVIDAGSLEFS